MPINRSMKLTLLTGCKKLLGWFRFSGQCDHCGHANMSAARFCGRCGTAVTAKNNRFLRHGAIYLFYLVVLFSALTWRLVNADSGVPRLTAFSINERKGFTDLLLSMNKLQKPIAVFSGTDNSLSLDFNGVLINKNLVEKAFSGRDFRLAYFVENSKEDKISRVRLFPQPGCLATVRYQQDDVLVRLSAPKSLSIRKLRKNRSLINPQEEKNSPAVISLQNAPLVPAVTELATKAGIEVKFGDALPETFSLEVDAPTPFEAIKSLAKSCNLSFRREGKFWLLTRQTAKVFGPARKMNL